MTAPASPYEAAAFERFDARVEADRLGMRVQERRALKSVELRARIYKRMVALVSEGGALSSEGKAR